MNPLGVDRVICLCLDLRKDLWRELESQCLAKGWDFKPFICGGGGDRGLDPELTYDIIDTDERPILYNESIRYRSWWDRLNAYRAWKSHRRMIRQSLDAGYESVLFLEDDVTFFPDFDENLLKTEKTIKERNLEWDLFYLGSFTNQKHHLILPNIAVADVGVGGWHSVALKRNVMEKLLEFNPIGPYDWICQQYILHKYYGYYTVPPLTRQQGTFSWVEGHYLGRREEDNYQ